MLQKKEYVLNLDTRECAIRDLTEEFQPLEVPESAFYRGQAVVGVEGTNHLDVAIWVGTDSSGGEWGGIYATICTSILHINFAICVCVSIGTLYYITIVSVCLCVVPIYSQTCLVSTLKGTLNPYFLFLLESLIIGTRVIVLVKCTH